MELTELMSAFCMQHFLIGKVIPNNLGHAVGSLVVMPPSLNHFLVQNVDGSNPWHNSYFFVLFNFLSLFSLFSLFSLSDIIIISLHIYIEK